MRFVRACGGFSACWWWLALMMVMFGGCVGGGFVGGVLVANSSLPIHVCIDMLDVYT